MEQWMRFITFSLESSQDAFLFNIMLLELLHKSYGFRGLEVVPERAAGAPHDLPAVRRVDPGVQARLTVGGLRGGGGGGGRINKRHQARLDQLHALSIISPFYLRQCV